MLQTQTLESSPQFQLFAQALLQTMFVAMFINNLHNKIHIPGLNDLLIITAGLRAK